MNLQVNVLGNVKAEYAGVPLTLSAAKRRQLLALLALHADRSVSITALTEELWGGSKFGGSATKLHTLIGKLRQEIEQALDGDPECDVKQILVTEPSGYRLQIPAESVDVGRYRELSHVGRGYADRGEHALASDALGCGLALWRGPALSDIAPGAHLRIEIVRLEETRLADLDLRLEADLNLRRHRALLGELAALCEQFPMSENFSIKYMIALHRSGQQWRALKVYQRLRATMAGELGIEPSASTQRLHLAMLRGDPEVNQDIPLETRWLSSE